MWIIFSIFSALASATRSALSKSVITKNNEHVANWALWFWGLPILLITLAFLGLPQQVTFLFWLVLTINIFLNVLASLLFMRSLKLAPLSLIAPILSLMPIFVVIVSSIILKEIPSVLGFVGIMFAVLGTYFLNAKHLQFGVLEPIKELFRNAGSRYAMLLVPLWGITSTLDKVAIANSSPIFYLICISVGVALCFMFFYQT